MLVHLQEEDIKLPETETTSIVDLRERSQSSKRRWGWRVAVLAAVLLVLAFGGLKIRDQLMKPQLVAVPHLQGVPVSKAIDRAQAAGVKVSVTGSVPDYTIPKGRVVSQLPQSGKLLEGDRIRLIVSSGLPRFDVPKVVGESLGNARSDFSIVGMSVGDIQHKYSSESSSTVIAQQPSDGKLAWGSNIDLVVSRGPKPTAVPDVSGLNETKSIKELKAAGFHITRSTEFSNSVPKGDVISTSPSATTMLPAGSAIVVTISDGPRYREVTLPDVRTEQVSIARKQLEALGVLVKVVQSCGGNGTIVQETDPIPGTVVRQHTQVALFVC
jgi:beta-lactam-binding protein with PASTA domain